MNERIAFYEESAPSRHIRLIACGVLDETLLDGLGAFIDRQRRRISERAPEPEFPDEGI